MSSDDSQCKACHVSESSGGFTDISAVSDMHQETQSELSHMQRASTCRLFQFSSRQRASLACLGSFEYVSREKAHGVSAPTEWHSQVPYSRTSPGPCLS